MLTLCVIEDNEDLNDLLVEHLGQQDFNVRGFTSAAAYEASGLRADLFLLDLNLPNEDGISFAQRTKAQRPEAGIIVLSARAGSDARVQSYLSGVDAFLQKPCDLAEVTAALASAARRIRFHAAQGRRVAIPTLEKSGLRFVGPAGAVALTADEVRVIAALHDAPDQLLSYPEIMQLLTPARDLSLGALEVRIARLRRKVRPVVGDDQLIRSVRNTGYKLVRQIDVVP